MIKIQIHNPTQHYVLALNSTMQTSEIKLMHNSFPNIYVTVKQFVFYPCSCIQTGEGQP